MIYSKVLEMLAEQDSDYKEEIGLLVSQIMKELEKKQEGAMEKANYLLKEILNAHIRTKDKEKKDFLFETAKKLDESISKQEKEEVVCQV